jgi:diguanylate cyclase (GGDEF)-like protein
MEDYPTVALEKILEKVTPKEKDLVVGLIDRDPLTDALNRRRLARDLKMIVYMGARYNKGDSKDPKAGVVMIDIDDFKQYNDKFGHIVGDMVLKNLAECMREKLRLYDGLHFYRYGGEEFVLIAPGASVGDTMVVAEKMRKNAKQICGISFSIGVSHYMETTKDINSLVSDADKALRNAKNEGKDRVVVYNPALEELKNIFPS